MGNRSEYTIEVKALPDTEGAFFGDLSVFGNLDDVGDIVQKGAFDDTLRNGTHFPLLWQHDMTQPIGSFDVVSADGDALKIDGKFNLNTQRGREAYALLKANDINGLSIGYTVDKADWDQEGHRILEAVTLLEGSLVTFPANRLARAQAKQRLAMIEKKSRYAGCKFLQKMTDEERAAALEELEALDKAVKAEEDVTEEEQKPADEEKAKKEDEEDIEDEEDRMILEALKECSESARELNE